jgi:hypothetical protein
MPLGGSRIGHYKSWQVTSAAYSVDNCEMKVERPNVYSASSHPGCLRARASSKSSLQVSGTSSVSQLSRIKLKHSMK